MGYTFVIPAWGGRDLQIQGLTGPCLHGKFRVIVRDTASKTPGGRLLGRHRGLSSGSHTKEGFCHFSFIQAPRRVGHLGLTLNFCKVKSQKGMGFLRRMSWTVMAPSSKFGGESTGEAPRSDRSRGQTRGFVCQIFMAVTPCGTLRGRK